MGGETVRGCCRLDGLGFNEGKLFFCICEGGVLSLHLKVWLFGFFLPPETLPGGSGYHRLEVGASAGFDPEHMTPRSYLQLMVQEKELLHRPLALCMLWRESKLFFGMFLAGRLGRVWLPFWLLNVDLAVFLCRK